MKCCEINQYVVENTNFESELGNLTLVKPRNTSFVIIEMFKHWDLVQVVLNYLNQTQKEN